MLQDLCPEAQTGVQLIIEASTEECARVRDLINRRDLHLRHPADKVRQQRTRIQAKAQFRARDVIDLQIDRACADHGNRFTDVGEVIVKLCTRHDRPEIVKITRVNPVDRAAEIFVSVYHGGRGAADLHPDIGPGPVRADGRWWRCDGNNRHDGIRQSPRNGRTCTKGHRRSAEQAEGCFEHLHGKSPLAYAVLAERNSHHCRFRLQA